MADEKELWTRLVLRTGGYGPVEVWATQPVVAVADAIMKRHPIKIETGEYVHPDEIARFFSYALWQEKEAERTRLFDQYMEEKDLSDRRAKAKLGTRRRWFG